MDFKRLTINIVAVQATIDDRHYSAVYLGDDPKGNNFFRVYLNGKGVSSIVWDRKLRKFRTLRYTVHARNQGLTEGFVWPNEVKKKLLRKLLKGNIFRLVTVRPRKKKLT